ncbi:MAG: TRAP transporter small permease [Firmicutes bacterium]|nr:TRAP transporter small permease [Bacillota bacterium]
MFNKAFEAVEKYVTAFLFAVMCVVLILQVIFRTTGNPLSWSEEIARYLFVWIIYLAASRAMATEKHLTVDILPLILKGKANVILHIISTLITLACFAGLLYAGSFVLPNLLVKTQFSPATHVNMFFLYLAPTLGTALMTIRALQILFKDFKKLKNGDVHEVEEVTA